MRFIENIRRALKLPAPADSGKQEGIRQGEKVIVFIFAYIIALGMWALINLDRDFSLTVQLPLMYGEFPPDKAPLERLPEYTTATVTGEGWKLLNLYGSIPRIQVRPEAESFNVLETVRSQLAGHSDLNVIRVQPQSINIRLDERMTKKVPVESGVSLEFRRQFNLIGVPSFSPDSIEVSGARSLIRDIQSWPTRRAQLTDLHQPVNTYIELEPASELIKMSHSRVLFQANVSEFTEGEARVPIQLRGGAETRNYSITPSFVTIRYDVPVSQYSAASQMELFSAYVHIFQIFDDQTGYVEPVIETTTDDFTIRIRTVQPRRVSYFRIVRN